MSAPDTEGPTIWNHLKAVVLILVLMLPMLGLLAAAVWIALQGTEFTISGEELTGELVLYGALMVVSIALAIAIYQYYGGSGES